MRFTVQIHRGHRHYLAAVHFVLIQRTIDGNVANAGIEHGHDVERLYHIGAVLAGQGEIGLEEVVAFDCANLRGCLFADTRRVSTNLQQCEHQRGEFMPKRNTGEMHLCASGDTGNGEGRSPHILAIATGTDLVAQTGNLFQQ